MALIYYSLPLVGAVRLHVAGQLEDGDGLLGRLLLLQLLRTAVGQGGQRQDKYLQAPRVTTPTTKTFPPPLLGTFDNFEYVLITLCKL